MGCAERDRRCWSAPLLGKGKHSARADHRTWLAIDVTRTVRQLYRARGHHRQQGIPRLRGRTRKTGRTKAGHLRDWQRQAADYHDTAARRPQEIRHWPTNADAIASAEEKFGG